MKHLARHLTRVGIRRREEKPPAPPTGALDSWEPQREAAPPVEGEVLEPAR